MNYEWDEEKRKSNIEKHGIDFVAAKEIFSDAERIETIDDRHDHSEVRIQTIGYAKPGILFVVYTLRDNENTRRFISARKANKKERALYNSLIGHR
ncbi:MAG: BrnT family toxin [Gammaproteobacteria bacterium]|nr:BrnT family toxin [Gammaproteobacteria bacterium]